MENLISLKEINSSSYEDQLFLYEIIKYRWKYKNIINIKNKTNDSQPSFEEHCKNIQSNKYKNIYRINLHNISIGMIYIDINNYNGTFLLPNLLKKAFKILKQNNISFNKKLITPQIHLQLFKKHKDVNFHYASVNPKNKLSLDRLIENGYEPIEIILSIPTKNGNCLRGKWKSLE
jgi:hypothetical protein